MARTKKLKREPMSNLGALEEQIQSEFQRLYKLECELAKMVEKHCEPIKKDIAKLKKNLKADADVEIKDLMLFYKLLARQWDSEAMEEEDRNRVADAMHLVHSSLAKGEMMNWLEVVEKVDSEEPEHLREDAA